MNLNQKTKNKKTAFENYCEYFDIEIDELDEEELKKTKRAAKLFYDESKM